MELSYWSIITDSVYNSCLYVAGAAAQSDLASINVCVSGLLAGISSLTDSPKCTGVYSSQGLDIFPQSQSRDRMGQYSSPLFLTRIHLFPLTYTKFLLASMGVLAPGPAHTRPSSRPPMDTSGNVLAHVSAESPSNISPNPSEVISEVSEP